MLMTMTGAVAVADGWVHSFEGNKEDIIVMRGDERVPVRLLLTLQTGDEIKVSGSARLDLAFAGGRVVSLDAVTPTYSVHRRKDGTPVLTNFVDWASQLIAEWSQEEGGGRRAALASRQGAFSGTGATTGIVFASRFTAVLEQRAVQVLRWRGGTAPFRVEVANSNGVVDTQAALVEREVFLTDLAPGLYQLTIRGSEGDSGTLRLRIDEAPLAWQIPERFAALTEPERTAFSALDLADWRLGEYRFEALQRVLNAEQKEHPVLQAVATLLADPRADLTP